MDPTPYAELARRIARWATAIRRRPYVVAVTGGVAAGKSTIAGLLRAEASRNGPLPLDVAVVSTDGFLLPNAELARRGMLERKGFPESYDRAGLVRFLVELRSGSPVVTAPTYSHERYDVVPGVRQRVERADVVVLEGLHLVPEPTLGRVGTGPLGPGTVDGGLIGAGLVDLTVFVDAAEADARQWFLDRVSELRVRARSDRDAYLHGASVLDEDEFRALALGVWEAVNGPNLRHHVLPRRERADVVVGKGPGHEVRHVRPGGVRPTAP